MGIESEQLVLDYLSRVGDLAHGTSMTAAERAKLIGELRSTIEQRRARAEGVETTSSVRKILKSVGRPEEVVASTSGGEVTIPEPRTGDGSSTGRTSVRGLGARLFKGRGEGTGGAAPAGGSGPGGPVPQQPADAPTDRDAPTTGIGSGFPTTGSPPPHLAGMDELSAAESDPDWWRNDPSPYIKKSGGEIDGFIGGIEIPEMLKPPPKEGVAGEQPGVTRGLPAQGGEPAIEQDVPAEKAETPAGQGLLRRLRGGGLTAAGVPRAGGLVELAAVLTLVAGAALGNLIALGLGWLMAWWSPRLSRNEAKWAAAGMPALVAVGTAVWLWGRAGERWGEPIPEGALGEVLNESYPWLLRTAAAASAAFLLWRARRPR
ncbi:hypothetical protein MTQ01_04775 [Streptomyces sp. XM4193]|uniref:hypothetical protein n=1 Tax=Streptomyces sp. XM4193 TaxID=2929782 RepID=UPI001FFA248E|nr:hypothetical protein [Streptomyces sp. XM4193]MCK1795333.1 hypothetical protein [Streptomyces sp. XM4193]